MLQATRGKLIVYAVAVLPLVALFAIESRSGVPSGHVLARVAGIGSLWIFGLSLVLMLRTRAFDRWFGGLDQLYRLHHRIGVGAFLCALLHALATLSNAMPGGAAALSLLMSFEMSSATAAGWLSALLFSAFFVVTVDTRLSDRAWAWLHHLSVAGFAAATLHAGLVYRMSIDSGGILALAGVALGIAALAFRYLFVNHVMRDYLYTVAAVEHLPRSAVDVTLIPQGQALSFEPGQYLYVAFLNSSRYRACGEFHPFSVSSSPSAPGVHLVIKGLGRCSKHCQEIVPGVTAKIQGPFGQLFYNIRPEEPQLWIAGGMGITPFLSRLRSGVGVAGSIELFYLARDRATAPFADEVLALARALPAVHVTLWLSSEQSVFSLSVIERRVSDLFARQIFLSGPPALVENLRDELLRRGVMAERIHAEDFYFR